MIKFLLVFLGLIAVQSMSMASDSLKVILNGKRYSCSEESDGGSGGANCECKANGNGYTCLYLNGANVNNWIGTDGDAMKSCLQFLKGQSYCK